MGAVPIDGRRYLACLMVIMMVTGFAPKATAAGLATVVSTEAVNIRACPRLDCAVLAVAPLGKNVTVTGDPVAGFIPVGYAGVNGYAYALYLAPVGGIAPTFVEGAAGCQRVALIFNVGIGNAPALSILDTLTAEDVPATMFLMGWWAEQHPDLVGEMAARGLTIGSHGHDRGELTALSNAEVAQDLRASVAAIGGTGTVLGPWFTPYAAAIDDRVRTIVAAEGFLPVGWRLAAVDYGPEATAIGVYNRIVPKIYDGAIVELHFDGPVSATSTAVALPWIIKDLRDQGYQFVSIPDMAMPCA